MMRKATSKWVRFTEETNALDYLEEAYRHIQLVDRRRASWKWVIIGLHGALYGFAICSCMHSSKENVVWVTKKGRRKLIRFHEALVLCQPPKFTAWNVFHKPLIITQEQRRSIEFLSKELRNNFEHYQPMSWSIELHALPGMAINALDVARFLAVESGSYSSMMLTSTQRRRIKSLVYQGKRILKKSKLYQEFLMVEGRKKPHRPVPR